MAAAMAEVRVEVVVLRMRRGSRGHWRVCLPLRRFDKRAKQCGLAQQASAGFPADTRHAMHGVYRRACRPTGPHPAHNRRVSTGETPNPIFC